MTPDQQAAVTRGHRCRAGENPYHVFMPECFNEGKLIGTWKESDEAIYSMMVRDDGNALRALALSEHVLDDGLAPDEAWLLSAGFTKRQGGLAVRIDVNDPDNWITGSGAVYEHGKIVLHEINGEFSLAGFGVRLTTRSQLRKLLEALTGKDHPNA